MKLTKANLRDTAQAFSSRLLAADKGHDLTYESGVLYVRSKEHPDKVFLFPASNVVSMEAEETPKKK